MAAVPRETLTYDDGGSLHGRCGHCGVEVDNYDANHRVSAIMRGGRGVECVLRGDIKPHEARPLGKRPPTPKPDRTYDWSGAGRTA